MVVYEISVYTGTQPGAETNSNVHITIFGNQGDSGKRKLRKSSTNKVTFQRGQVKKNIQNPIGINKQLATQLNSGKINLSYKA